MIKIHQRHCELVRAVQFDFANAPAWISNNSDTVNDIPVNMFRRCSKDPLQPFGSNANSHCCQSWLLDDLPNNYNSYHSTDNRHQERHNKWGNRRVGKRRIDRKSNKAKGQTLAITMICTHLCRKLVREYEK
jgi:hypothetical protein